MAHYEKFKNKRFSQVYLEMLKHILAIITNYAEQSLDLSLRQLYYQLVARDLFPDSWVSKKTGSKNCVENYKRLVALVGDGREAGIIPWDAIVDRNRSNMKASTWDTPTDIMASAVNSFRMDLWEDQPYHVHMMVEKDALSGVLWPICHRFGVEFTANKGYSSLSMLYWSAKKFEVMASRGKKVLVLYMGDHDPSGMDMTRDIEERIRQFSGLWRPSNFAQLEVKRLALNYDQVEKYDPPENFAKETDSRFQDYYAQFGDTCWELDALEPSVMRDLIENELNRVIDDDAWKAAKQTEEEERGKLKRLTGDVKSLGIEEAIDILDREIDDEW